MKLQSKFHESKKKKHGYGQVPIRVPDTKEKLLLLYGHYGHNKRERSSKSRKRNYGAPT
jgi:hypothetical protein